MVIRIVLVLFFMTGVAAAETYRWTDVNGSLNFTDNYNKIPARYHQQVQIVEEAPYNSIPANHATKSARMKSKKHARTDAGENLHGDNATAVKKRRKSDTAWAEKEKGHGNHQEKSLVTTKTPARRDQDRLEEQLRRERHSLDDNMLPARRAMDMNEENIRRTRDSTYGH